MSRRNPKHGRVARPPRTAGAEDARTPLSSWQAYSKAARAHAAAFGALHARCPGRKLLPVVYPVAVLSLLLASVSPSSAAAPTNGLVARYDFNGNARDAAGKGHHGVVHNATPTSNRFGNGSSAYSFNGTDAYIEIPDHGNFSVSTTGKLSISVWMRPGTLRFPDPEGTGYVHWMGKGVTNQHEWAFRMYSSDNTEGRGNRTSFYLFNRAGGLGAGSYVQEAVAPGAWYHYVAVVDTRSDTIRWYKNGVLRDQDSFIASVYQIDPRNGTAPVRVGTKDFASHFKGAIDNIAVYNRALSASEVVRLYNDTGP